MQFNAQFLIAVAVAVESLFFLPRAAQAAGQTDEAVLEGRTYFVSLDYTLPSEIFLDRFFQEVGTSDSVVFDRFGAGVERRPDCPQTVNERIDKQRTTAPGPMDFRNHRQP